MHFVVSFERIDENSSHTQEWQPGDNQSRSLSFLQLKEAQLFFCTPLNHVKLQAKRCGHGFPNLYDKTLTSYWDLNKKNDAWRNITCEINFSVVCQYRNYVHDTTTSTSLRLVWEAGHFCMCDQGKYTITYTSVFTKPKAQIGCLKAYQWFWIRETCKLRIYTVMV